MKRFLLLLAMCFSIGMANAQVSGFYVDDGIYLSDRQWHYDNLSIVEANNSLYLIITPYEYYYSYLDPINQEEVSYFINDDIVSCSPYVRGSVIGWLVCGRYERYFVYRRYNSLCYVKLLAAPVFYNYSYNLYGKHFVDMRRWHFAPPPGPRPHHYDRHFGSRPQNRHHGTPPKGNPNHGGGYIPGGHGSPRPSGKNVNSGIGNNRSGSTVRRPSSLPENRGSSARPSPPLRSSRSSQRSLASPHSRRR